MEKWRRGDVIYFLICSLLAEFVYMPFYLGWNSLLDPQYATHSALKKIADNIIENLSDYKMLSEQLSLCVSYLGLSINWCLVIFSRVSWYWNTANL